MVAATLLGAGLLCLWRGAASRRSLLFGRCILRGPAGRRVVALTFDDGPSPATPELLRYLAAHGVRATFFVCGQNVQRHPEIARSVLAAGHELGNHTFSHPRLCPRLGWRINLLWPRTIAQELGHAQREIELATGARPRLFRAPYGLRWWGLRRAERRLGLQGVLWSVIGHDWEWPAERVARHVLGQVRPGAIVCLHDGRETRAEPEVQATLAAVRLIVPELQRRGYRLETVSGLLACGSAPARTD